MLYSYSYVIKKWKKNYLKTSENLWVPNKFSFTIWQKQNKQIKKENPIKHWREITPNNNIKQNKNTQPVVKLFQKHSNQLIMKQQQF